MNRGVVEMETRGLLFMALDRSKKLEAVLLKSRGRHMQRGDFDMQREIDAATAIPSSREELSMEPRALPWHASGQFVLRSDGTSVCRVNGMESDATMIAEAVNAKHSQANPGGNAK